MDVDNLLRHYLNQVRDGADSERIPFEIDQRVVGSVTPQVADLIAGHVPGVEYADDALEVLPVCAPDAPAALQAIATTLRDHGISSRWRDEQLPVCSDDGMLIGSIDRSCARALGIRTFAVHLNGQCHPNDQRYGPAHDHYTVWLQRRAPDKPVDPGLLDTLAGGLIGMDGNQMEPFGLGLQREISEEAGLEPTDYARPVHLQTVRMRWRLGTGFFREDCIVYSAQLVAGKVPVNRDGEVSEFLRVDRSELLKRIADSELTEAAAITSLLALQAHDQRMQG